MVLPDELKPLNRYTEDEINAIAEEYWEVNFSHQMRGGPKVADRIRKAMVSSFKIGFRHAVTISKLN